MTYTYITSSAENATAAWLHFLHKDCNKNNSANKLLVKENGRQETVCQYRLIFQQQTTSNYCEQNYQA